MKCFKRVLVRRILLIVAVVLCNVGSCLFAQDFQIFSASPAVLSFEKVGEVKYVLLDCGGRGLGYCSLPSDVTITEISPPGPDYLEVAVMGPRIRVELVTPHPRGRLTVLLNFVQNSKTIFRLPVDIAAEEVGSSGRNYVKSSAVLTEGIKSSVSVDDLSVSEKSVLINYFDGLGRSMQTVSWQASPAKMDIVQPIVYDELGRQGYQLLPYQSGKKTGEFRPNPNMTNYHGSTSEHRSFYSNPNNDVVTDPYPFSKTEFDNSPLNRVMEQGAPGADWQPSKHSVKYGYESNRSNDVCLMWVDATNNLKIGKSINGVFTRFYPANELYKKVVKDENWQSGQSFPLLNTTEEYTDKEGKVVLKRTFVEKSGGFDKVETYYVYDDFGLLRYVLPPKASAYFSSATATSYSSTHGYITESCYYYKYDGRKRMIEKKIPGAALVYLIYDSRDRLVLTQDGNQRASRKWSFTKYDALNRPIQTGELIAKQSYGRLAMQEYLDAAMQSRTFYETRTSTSSNYYYSNTGFPNSSDGTINSLTITYYDTYPTAPSFSITHNVCDFRESGATPYYFDRLKGLVTRKLVREISPTGFGGFITTNYFYDDKYRVIQKSESHSGNDANEVFSYRYDFTGKTLQERHFLSYNRGNDKVVVDKYFTYDHAGRLLTIEQEVEGDDLNGRVVIAKHEYNALGQLKRKHLHKTADMSGYLQTIDYDYNIRSWLTSINNPDSPGNDLFSMRLYYNSLPDLVHSQPNFPVNYNGNITAQTVYNKDKSGNLYSYDAMNRFTSNLYLMPSANRWLTQPRNREYDVKYDLNGNLLALKRSDAGSRVIDNLTYNGYASYGNKLTSVSDAASYSGYAPTGTFSYDANGNLISNGQKHFSYNSLNLLSNVSYYDNYMYFYDAEGRKLRKQTDNVIDYGMFDDIRYYNNGIETYWSYSQIDRLLDLIHHDEGVIRVSYGSDYKPVYTYEYFLKDHLGNTRVAFKRGTGETAIALQRSDYYPFGLRQTPYNPESDNKYLYNGKEIQDETGWYDYGFRFYDPALARWHCVDPLAEKYYSLSTYAYCANNPIRLYDVDGRYFDDKNEKKAARIERRAERRADRLESKADRIDNRGGNSGDLRARAGELRQSATDIGDMRNDANTEYRYSGLNSKEAKNNNIVGPTATQTGVNAKGDNVVTMFTENKMGSKLHEGRHGGDIARGTLQFNANGGYGVSHEISAYKAQYSWSGQLQYRDQPNQAVILQRMMAGQNPTTGTITNINQINANVVNSMVDPGFVPIYPPRNANGVLIIPLNIWNTH